LKDAELRIAKEMPCCCFIRINISKLINNKSCVALSNYHDLIITILFIIINVSNIHFYYILQIAICSNEHYPHIVAKCDRLTSIILGRVRYCLHVPWIPPVALTPLFFIRIWSTLSAKIPDPAIREIAHRGNDFSLRLQTHHPGLIYAPTLVPPASDHLKFIVNCTDSFQTHSVLHV